MPFLNFKGKTAVETYHHALPHHTLDFAPDLSVLDASTEPSLDGNLIIEGDNLLALKALLPTHAGRIKCAYLDPPYNTGNEGWVYNDNLTQPQFKEWIGKEVGKEAEDACRHDKWCCMMYPRLMLLKELLRDDGVIFISIDDNEVAHLRLLMDEIFGAENFVANVVWQKKYAVSSDAKGIPPMHDHILVYQRTGAFTPSMLARTDKQDALYKNPDNDTRGLWRPDNLLRSEYRERDFYKITSPLTGKEFWPPEGSSWRHPQNVVEKMIADNRIWFGEHGNNRPVPKRFLAEVRQGITASAWWPHTEVGHNDESKKELQEIFGGESPFPTPKPTRLIKRILELATGEDDLVLDSFAGSGTTAQAVLEVNREDGGNRKFILVQQRSESVDQARAEMNICQSITSERVRRVIGGYAFEGNHVDTLLEEKVGLNTLKKTDALLARIDEARKNGQDRFGQVRSEMKDGVVRVEGVTKITENKPGLGGSFTYARLSDKPLFGEFRDLGDSLPSYEELARYVFFTETSRQWTPAGMVPETGKIGESVGVSYYLLYRPNQQEDWGMDLPFLKVAAADPNKTIVVYSEMLRVHRDDLRRWQAESGKTIRSMIVPYHLK